MYIHIHMMWSSHSGDRDANNFIELAPLHHPQRQRLCSRRPQGSGRRPQLRHMKQLRCAHILTNVQLLVPEKSVDDIEESKQDIPGHSAENNSQQGPLGSASCVMCQQNQ